MPMHVWQRQVVEPDGAVVPSALVEVRRARDNALAVLYSDRAGETLMPNPFRTDSRGEAKFYAAPGLYHIKATQFGRERVWENVRLGVLAEWLPDITEYVESKVFLISLTSISPNTALQGTGGFEMTLLGANFRESAIVMWDSVELETEFVSSTELTAVVPDNLIEVAGTKQIRVVDGQLFSNTLPFLVELSHEVILGVIADKDFIKRSVDGGFTWEDVEIGQTGFRAITYIPAYKRFAIAGSAGRIWTSDDGGLTWAERDSGVPNVFYAIASLDQFDLVVARARQLDSNNPERMVWSDDGGVTWSVGTIDEPIATQYGSARIVDCPRDGAGGYAFSIRQGGSEGLVSFDGKSWNEVSMSPAVGTSSLLYARWLETAFSGDSNNRVVSTGDGTNWVLAFQGFSVAAGGTIVDDENEIASWFNSEHFMTTTDGVEFNRIETEIFTAAAGGFAGVKSRKFGTYVAIGRTSFFNNGEIAVSEDLGETWAIRSTWANAFSDGLGMAVGPTPLPIPVIDEVSPPGAPLNSPIDVDLVITGNFFEDGAKATLNGQELESEYVSRTEMRAKVPPELTGEEGVFDLRVINPGDQQSEPVDFSIEEGDLWDIGDATGVKLWLDASDDSTITYDESDRVSAWTDKSENEYTFVQATSGKQPLRVDNGVHLDNTPNGAITDNSTCKDLRLANQLILRGYPFTVYCVVDSHEGDRNGVVIATNISSGQYAGPQVGQDSIITMHRNSTVRSAIYSTSALQGGGRALSRHDYVSNVLRSVDVNASGSPVHNTDTSDDLPTGTGATYLGIERSPTAVNPANGLTATIRTIVVLDHTPTEREDWLISGSLMWKWGLEDELPDNHPFKGAPPRIVRASS